ncbi:hypothetical protein GF402_08715 [Candidatus Fermentibacteria bacterium]|nr:hypothetical protein [Candidatus Fermentibacteria bacterium]
MLRICVQIASVVIIVAGLIIFPLPIPLGAVLFTVGLGLLVSSSNDTARFLMRLRRRHPGFDCWMKRAEHRLPGSIGRIMRRTTPD